MDARQLSLGFTDIETISGERTKGLTDIETISDKRPKGLTKKQRDAVLVSLAQDVVKNGWVDKIYLNTEEAGNDISTDNISYNPYGIYTDIVADLELLDGNDNGYENAKTLEDDGCCSYNIDSDFVGWLDVFDVYFRRAADAIVKAWVAASGLKPKYHVGTVFTSGKDIHPKLPAGTTLYINSIFEEYGVYRVWSEIGSHRNFAVNFEDFEDLADSIITIPQCTTFSMPNMASDLSEGALKKLECVTLIEIPISVVYVRDGSFRLLKSLKSSDSLIVKHIGQYPCVYVKHLGEYHYDFHKGTEFYLGEIIEQYFGCDSVEIRGYRDFVDYVNEQMTQAKVI